MPEFDQAALVVRLRQSLMATASPDGGWPYYAGKSSRIEPTAWALLALTETFDQDAAAHQEFLRPHLRFLATCQRADGLLLDEPQAPPNFTANGTVACVLAHVATTDNRQVLTRLLDGIVATKGVAIRTPLLDAIAAIKSLGSTVTERRQDNTLQAWPWIPDTFSWTEPTAWCLLALKKAAPLSYDDNGPRALEAKARVLEAEHLLANRVCTNGGWNYGNASAFAQDLRPYVATTAVALMALQDRPADPAVARSLAFLGRARLSEPSAMALGLTAIALGLQGQDVEDVHAHLAGDVERAERIGNLQSLAIGLYALSGARHQMKAFRV